MKKYRTFVINLAVFLIAGFIFSLILSYYYSDLYFILMSGFFYSLNVVIALSVANRYVVSKFEVLSVFETWILRTFLYILAVSFAYTSGFAFQNFLLAHHASIGSYLLTSVRDAVIFLISMPFSDKSITDLVKPETRKFFTSFFSMIFLIGIISMVASYVEIRWRSEKQKRLLLDAELKAWRSQIEPHFLFNSLNTIVSTVRNDPPKAEKLLIQLSELLRFLFNQSKLELISLKDEIAFTKNYLDLMKARYPQFLSIGFRDESDDHEIQLPPLTLQPIVENCIKHGWNNKNEKFRIEIHIYHQEKHLLIKIADNGVGIDKIQMQSIPQEGHALHILKQRLQLIFDDIEPLIIRSESKQGTEAIIKIPGQ